jgi:hypothetical protein
MNILVVALFVASSLCSAAENSYTHPPTIFEPYTRSSSSVGSLSLDTLPQHHLSLPQTLRPEAMQKADALFFSGDRTGLIKMKENHESWLSNFTFNLRENKLAAQYAKDLLGREELDLFSALHTASTSEVKPILSRIMDTTRDPLVQVEAIIIADDRVGRIICDYGSEFRLKLTQDEATDLMVTTRFGSHAVHKLLPDPQTHAYDQADGLNYIRQALRTIDQFPEAARETLICQAIEGFIEYASRPDIMVGQHWCALREISTTMYDEALGYYLRGPEYELVRKQEVQKFFDDVGDRLSKATPKDMARAVGHSCAHGLMVGAYVKAGQCAYQTGKYAYNAASSAYAARYGATTVEDLMEGCAFKDKTKSVRNHDCEITFEEMTSKFDRLKCDKETFSSSRGTPVRIKHFSDGSKVVLRKVSEEGHPTVDLQHTVGKTDKLRILK